MRKFSKKSLIRKLYKRKAELGFSKSSGSLLMDFYIAAMKTNPRQDNILGGGGLNSKILQNVLFFYNFFCFIIIFRGGGAKPPSDLRPD